MGSFAAGRFYLPLKKISKWSWESGWLFNGLFSWIITTQVVALLTVPDLFSVIFSASPAVLAWTFAFGLLWGIGGLTFGLPVRYLGLSLGNGVALGFCTAFGTLVPAIDDGSIITLLTTVPGPVLQIGNTDSRYRFSIGTRRFMNDWAKGGPAHHCTIGTGHVSNKIEKLAKLPGIAFVKIC